MQISRREVIASAVVVGVATMLPTKAFAQAPASSPRMPLSKFLASPANVETLRRGIKAMKDRKPYDPFSWFYQAAIHGVTESKIASEIAKFPEAVRKEVEAKVKAVFKKRYWNQCPHGGEEAANFLPWHRGYTYYFERILRMHTGDPQFSLPFWDYEPKANRKFPKAFGEQLPDANGDSTNPLYLEERDFYFCGYDHPYTKDLPLLELTDKAVDFDEDTLKTLVFFGDTESEGLGGGYADEDASTRGGLERSPHDHIHRAVGGVVTGADGQVGIGAMAQPPTAGFDPIFPMHHANIDRLWAKWACQPGKSWGRKLPPVEWFEERPWYFWDVASNGTPVRVREPRKMYFDHRALGVRFEGEDENCQPLQLPDFKTAVFAVASEKRAMIEVIAAQDAEAQLNPLGRTVIPLATNLKSQLTSVATLMKAVPSPTERPRSILIRLGDLDLGLVPATGFDVHVTGNQDASLNRNDKTFVGSVALFRHQPTRQETTHGGHHMETPEQGAGDVFDISDSVASMNDAELSSAAVVIVPYRLLAMPGTETLFLPPSNGLSRIGSLELLITR
jgi:hypothetical protein